MRAVLLGIIASVFFSTTFLLNRSMSLEGGSYMWSAALRFLFMLPPLLLIVWLRGSLRALLTDMKHHMRTWFVWGFVGFGIFYTLTCFAGDYGPGWLIAGTWQLTIICGPLLAPVFGEKIPWANLRWSLFILIGVVIMQIDHAQAVSVKEVVLTVGPLIIAAIAYPLGNRKMMTHIQGSLDTFARILGMILASLPWWLLLVIYGTITEGLPTASQTGQSLLVALCSGLIATTLFFYATELAAGDQSMLALVEATQSAQVIFTLLGELLILHSHLPSALALNGILIVCLGIIMQSRMRLKAPAAKKAATTTN
ncbi:DMT family transporter [Brevibacillus dissolubilis]|uniref:DMT family transporter n=1 Tax=Brevibacillus dissolubilis TaxID=1844116 RepID=UPI001116F0FD|nr:multidrug resistance efflux transporter family protein [Brevibacillus dissolubilis]